MLRFDSSTFLCNNCTHMNNDNSSLTVEGILLLIGLQARTGELVLESGNNIGSVFFHEGKVLQALSPYSRAIGDLLVEDGVLTDAELLEVLKFQKNEPDRPIGSLLMQIGKVSFEVIEMMVHEQIRTTVSEFKGWSDISINFIDKDIKPFDTIHLPVHALLDVTFLNAALDSLSRIVTIKNESASNTASAS